MKRKVHSSFSSAPRHNRISNPGNNGFASQQVFLPHHLAAQNGHAGMPILGSQPQGQFRSPNSLQNMSQFASFPPYQQVMPPNLNQMMPQQLHGQCFLQNQAQNLNQIMPSGFPQNLNQMMGLPQGQLFLPNPMGNLNQIMSMQCTQLPISPTQVVPFNIPPCSLLPWGDANQHAPQNPVFSVNLQSGVGNSNMNQDAIQESPVAPQPLQGNLGPGQMHGNHNHLQNAGYQSQGNHIEENGNDISKTKQGGPSSKNFTRNHHMSGKRELSHTRFQKSQRHHTTNAEKNFGPTSKHGDGGKNSGRSWKPSLESRKAARECQRSQRSISLNYTEEEIRLWREARKKNFPTKITTEKKLAEGSKFNDPGAEMRRKQLKEILAKQSELGVEVAELPPNYLSDTENQISGGKDDRMVQNRMGKFKNKFSKRNKHGRNKQHAKRRKLGYEPSQAPTANNREPTLLQKLLSADIKRDKSHLLQVFRFMVLNAFFKEWPDKPLQFPLITVKSSGCENDTVSKIYSLNERGNTASGVGKNVLVEATGIENHDNSVVDEDNNEEDDDNSGGEEMTNEYDVVENGFTREQTEKSEEEEGEMTD